MTVLRGIALDDIPGVQVQRAEIPPPEAADGVETVLVVTYDPERLCDRDFEHIHKGMAEAFPHHKKLYLPDGVALSVLQVPRA
jgi:hypothetical protein